MIISQNTMSFQFENNRNILIENYFSCLLSVIIWSYQYLILHIKIVFLSADAPNSETLDYDNMSYFLQLQKDIGFFFVHSNRERIKLPDVNRWFAHRSDFFPPQLSFHILIKVGKHLYFDSEFLLVNSFRYEYSGVIMLSCCMFQYIF